MVEGILNSTSCPMPVSLFDSNYYRAVNPDLARLSDAQALNHFQAAGVFEGRQFSAFVDLATYRASNPDLASLNNRQLFNHLEQSGVAEGRTFSPFVDLTYYKLANPDLASFNNERLFTHLFSAGINEGRRFSSVFDSSVYAFFNQDLVAARLNGKQAFEHWQVAGLNEGRKFSQFIDLAYYKSINTDLSRMTNAQALNHLIQGGMNEGRLYSNTFSTEFYKTENPDLAATGMTNAQLLRHFQLSGINEGRMGSANFNARVYMSNNADLANLTPFQAITHFILTNGARSGIDYAGNTSSTGRMVTLTPDGRAVRFTDHLGYQDTSDIYRFTLSTASTVQIDLSGFASAEVMQLTSGAGSPITAVSSGSGVARSLSADLQPGSYAVALNAGQNIKGLYNISLSTVPTDTAGNTRATARTLQLGERVNEFIGGNDTNDYYKFTLTSRTEIEAAISRFSSNVDLQLINSTGQIIGGSSNGGIVTDSLNRTLDAGEYYLQVFQPAGTTATSYQITVVAPNSGGGGSSLWTRQRGTVEDDVSQDVAIDSSGNVYIVGYTYGFLGTGSQIHAGDQDAFISKYNASGVLQWTQQLDLAGDDSFASVAIDSQGIIYAGGFSSVNSFQGIVRAYNASGEQVTTRNFTYGSRMIQDLEFNSSGSLVVGNGQQVAFFTPGAASGSTQPVSSFAVADDFTSMALDASGNVYVSGNTTGRLDPNLTNNLGQGDAWVAKYNAQGVSQWIRQVGTTAYDESSAVTVDSSGNVYIAGTTSGSFDSTQTVPANSNDLWYAKFNATGTQMWVKQNFTRDNPEDGAYDIKVGSNGVYVAGLQGFRPLLLKVNSGDGSILTTRQLGSATASEATESSVQGLVIDSTGFLYLTGDTKESLNPQAVANAGGRDAWVAKIQD